MAGIVHLRLANACPTSPPLHPSPPLRFGSPTSLRPSLPLYPLQVRQCLSNLVKKTSEEIYLEYGYPALRMADAIRNRSRGEEGGEGYVELCGATLHCALSMRYATGLGKCGTQ